MTPEDRFLLAGAHSNLDEEGKRRLCSFLSQPLNWADIERKAIQHGVAPLVYFNLRNENMHHHLPAEVLAKFQVSFYKTGLRNITIYEELARILERSEESGVEVAVVKGAALAWTVYRDPALRRMIDIDLFVRTSSHTALESVLESCGFFLDMHDPKALGIRIDSYQHGVHGLRLDISCFSDKRIERMWSEKNYLETTEARIPTLRCEEHLIYLCVHAIGHVTLNGLNYLLWLCDINELIRWANRNLDWEFLRSRAKELHVQHIVYMMLSLSRRLLETPISDGILKNLRYSILKEKTLAATLISPERFLSANKSPGYLRSLFNLVCLLDRWKDIMLFLPYLE